MPRSPTIEQFTEKLNLMCDRLSLSRVQLAHAVGVDKSGGCALDVGPGTPG